MFIKSLPNIYHIYLKSLRNIYQIYLYQIFNVNGHQAPYPNNLPLGDWSSQRRISFSIYTIPLEALHNLNVPTSTQNVCWIPCTLYLLQTHHLLPLTSNWNDITFCVLSLNDKLSSSLTTWHFNYLPKESSHAASCLILLDSLSSISSSFQLQLLPCTQPQQMKEQRFSEA